MKKQIILILFFFPVFLFSQTNYKKLANSLKYINDIPRAEGACYDSVYWQVVAGGLEVIPFLIEKRYDTKKLKDIYVYYTGGEYTIADVSYHG